ncbi:MAG TPA: heavy-metal-associated domain-containing protein, partial [Limnochordales bacterium]
MRKETMLLTNLNCPSCAAQLQQALTRTNGVRRAEVAFATGTVDLGYDERVVTPVDIERLGARFGA